ncbi:A/G-specific adenine glycosylase [Rummeliibacillus sp. TYF005]|uniref:A/G-specific adenine glycosylase n=1 Tax=Rummeliibacillus sp. TYF005 TaxID=2058214 RepID=UPI000F5456D6|nr:A/G-specific adenine glycosylase [Rummeliibacillus sp. TYF005]RPJ95943.1 A/G-specific adenine glycosylase [Rummeliibacillus sp. TYF005]
MYYQYKKQFQQALVEWFEQEKRDLPWRKTKDPYKIWVSEVMLQQTRVDTVIPYYNRFMQEFPTPEALAKAPEEKLLKQWEGLGYYSRARNLQDGVREVVETYGGKVPDNRPEISKLKGVGPYTAGAVLSIAYNKAEHAVDGNVMRVLSRVLLIDEDIAIPKTKKTFEQAVMELIDTEHPSQFNQGLMELGALVCTPTSPKCLLCPVREYCTAFNEGNPEELPVKTKKVKTKNLHYDVFVVQNEKDQFLLEKRPEKGLLANMWQFPMLEQTDIEEHTNEAKLADIYKLELINRDQLMSFKHVFSHLVWHMDSYVISAQQIGDAPDNSNWFSIEEMKELPMPVPMQKIWQKFNLNL